MRLASLKIRWFRGASEEATFTLGNKSFVVYGENGAGKSSFVDGIEYVLNQGRIGHLAHEHSGRRQEKAILNTHTPEGEVGKVEIVLEDKSETCVSILRNGSFSMNPEDSEIQRWGYQHTILRQHELANFIIDTKGGKYSSLLPLLGLGDLEIAAENLRQLEKIVSEQAGISAKKAKLEDIEKKAGQVFSEQQKFDHALDALYKKYTRKERPYDKESYKQSVTIILDELKDRIDKLSEVEKTHTTLLEISRLPIVSNIELVRSSALTLSKLTEPLINERLSILEEVDEFAKHLTPGNIVDCPACGTSVSVESFNDHVANEKEKLKEAAKHFGNHKNNIRILCDTLQDFKRLYNKAEVKDWQTLLKAENIKHLAKLNLDELRKNLTNEAVEKIEVHIIPILDLASETVKDAPPKIQELLDDQKSALLICEIIDSQTTAEYVSKIDLLIIFIAKLQKVMREEIRVRSTTTIGSISDDIARMWEILHPNEKIEDVHLYLPSDTDKAIEIGLKFYGIEQPSPRLTLSEGHRNSLGLCIFLAMAKHNTEQAPPIFLDDVVVSFDRGHRGMVAELLEKEFSDRQIILFTHDREWFIELKHLLNSSTWEFRALRPWDDPSTGIRWSEKDSTFDDARSLVETEPAAAGNTARKIMDIHLAIISEKLEIKLPYLHRERNDHRMAHDFLERIIKNAPVCFEIQDGKAYKSFDSAYDFLRNADNLLVAWGNRASHSFDTTKSEAQKLIKACEDALNVFVCPSCKKMVTKANDSSAKVRQCQCGTLRWRYDKA